MGSEDSEKKKKKKKKKEEAAEEAPPEPPKDESSKKKKSGSKKKSSKRKSAQRGSGVFSLFSEKMCAEFKEGFHFFDFDKDGIIGKEDLRRAFDIVGKLASDKELDEMLDEPPQPLTFTMFLTMFGERMSGEADEDEVIIAAFKAFDNGEGGIDDRMLEDYLSTWGEKFTPAEVKEIFPQLPRLDEGPHANFIHINEVCRMLTASAADEEETGTETGGE